MAANLEGVSRLEERADEAAFTPAFDIMLRGLIAGTEGKPGWMRVPQLCLEAGARIEVAVRVAGETGVECGKLDGEGLG
jgi:hypothetical protein